MKTTVRRLCAVILMTAMMLTLLTGCGAKGDIKKTISTFESACHELDVKGMLECMNPIISKPILGAMDLFGVEDTSGLLDKLVGTLSFFEAAGEATEEFVRSIEFNPTDFAFNSDKDKCTVLAELKYGEDTTKVVTIEMILRDEVWYIGNIRF